VQQGETRKEKARPVYLGGAATEQSRQERDEARKGSSIAPVEKGNSDVCAGSLPWGDECRGKPGSSEDPEKEKEIWGKGGRDRGHIGKSR